jgi:hypothetical protein
MERPAFTTPALFTSERSPEGEHPRDQDQRDQHQR